MDVIFEGRSFRLILNGNRDSSENCLSGKCQAIFLRDGRTMTFDFQIRAPYISIEKRNSPPKFAEEIIFFHTHNWEYGPYQEKYHQISKYQLKDALDQKAVIDLICEKIFARATEIQTEIIIKMQSGDFDPKQWPRLNLPILFEQDLIDRGLLAKHDAQVCLVLT